MFRPTKKNATKVIPVAERRWETRHRRQSDVAKSNQFFHNQLSQEHRFFRYEIDKKESERGNLKI